MTLTATVESLLKEVEADRIKALLLWYLQDNASEDAAEATSPNVQALLDDISRMDADTSYQALSALDLDDLVRFAVINEFGEGFSRQKAGEFLIAATAERFAIAADIEARDAEQ